jgi:TRAP-type mannitol/chloroaromatic compound transport system permease small subunit
MKRFLTIIVQFFGTINEWIGRAVSWLTLVLVLLVCYNVLSRRVFDLADSWRGELEWHLFAMMFLLGAGYAFKHERHVRVDLFYTKYSPKDRAWTNLLGGLLFLIPWCVVVIIYAWSFAKGAWSINESSPNPDGLPYRFVIKFAISFGIGLLLLQALASIAEAILVIRGEHSSGLKKLE